MDRVLYPAELGHRAALKPAPIHWLPPKAWVLDLGRLITPALNMLTVRTIGADDYVVREDGQRIAASTLPASTRPACGSGISMS